MSRGLQLWPNYKDAFRLARRTARQIEKSTSYVGGETKLSPALAARAARPVWQRVVVPDCHVQLGHSGSLRRLELCYFDFVRIEANVRRPRCALPVLPAVIRVAQTRALGLPSVHRDDPPPSCQLNPVPITGCVATSVNAASSSTSMSSTIGVISLSP